MSGWSSGSFGAANIGSSDVVIIKLDADGNELWRWQVSGGTTRYAMRTTVADDGVSWLYIVELRPKLRERDV